MRDKLDYFGVAMDGKVVNGVSYSKREIDVIACICNGCSAKVIARILNISLNTVNSHIRNILHKSNYNSKHEIIKLIESSCEYEFIQNKYIEIRFKAELSAQNFSDWEPNNYHEVKHRFDIVLRHKLPCAVILGIFLSIGSYALFFKEHYCVSYEIPQINDKIFLPRTEILDEIDGKVSSRQGVKIIALTGEAGIGKTTIARRYLNIHQFEVKAEIDAESEFKIIKSFEDLLFLLCKTDEQRNILQAIKIIKNLDEKRKKLKAFLANLLKNYKNWCFLYDNVEDLDMLKRWLPLDCNLFKNGLVVITTRNAHVNHLISPCVIDVVKINHLSYDESEKLFCSLLNWPNKNFAYDKNVVESLLKSLPAVPLDISSVAHFIRINNMNLEEYSRLIKKNGEKRMNYKIPSEFTDYDKTRETIVATTFNKILNASEHNFELLMMLCLLDSQSINKKSFQLITSDEAVDEFFSYLKKYSILDEKDKSFSIHRLTQEMGFIYLLENFSREKIRAFLVKIVDVLAAYGQIEWKWFKSENKILKEDVNGLIPHLESMLSKLELYKDLENIDEYKIKILTALYFAYNGKLSYKDVYERGKILLKFNSRKNVITGWDLAVLLLQQIYVSVYCGETDDIEKNAKECLKICDQTENSDHLKMGTMLYLCRYYFDFVPCYDKAQDLLHEIFEFKKTLSTADWEIVMCVFASQIYRSYESCYISDKSKMLEAIGYLQQALINKGFTENYWKNNIKNIPVDKAVFVMYAIEMMINIARAYNMLGNFDEAFKSEQNILYIYNLLCKRGIRFYSQEFQVNRVLGETLLRKGKIKESHKVLSEALESGNISSAIDLFCVYVLKAEANIALGKYNDALKDCENALKLKPQSSNYFLLNMCKCMYFKFVSHHKKNQINEARKIFGKLKETAAKLSNELETTNGLKIVLEIDDLRNNEDIEKIISQIRSFFDRVCCKNYLEA